MNCIIPLRIITNNSENKLIYFRKKSCFGARTTFQRSRTLLPGCAVGDETPKHQLWAIVANLPSLCGLGQAIACKVPVMLFTHKCSVDYDARTLNSESRSRSIWFVHLFCFEFTLPCLHSFKSSLQLSYMCLFCLDRCSALSLVRRHFITIILGPLI